VARRHELNVNLLFKWKEKFEAEMTFLPIEVKTSCSQVPVINDVVDCIEQEAPEEISTSVTPLEILLPCGTQLRYGKGTDPDVLSHALNVLRRIT